MSEKSNKKPERFDGFVRNNEFQIIPIDNEFEIAEFVPLNVDKDYEILTVPPHTIRRKDNHKEIRATLCTHCCSNTTHLVIALNGKLYLEDEIIKFYNNLYNRVYD